MKVLFKRCVDLVYRPLSQFPAVCVSSLGTSFLYSPLALPASCSVPLPEIAPHQLAP